LIFAIPSYLSVPHSFFLNATPSAIYTLSLHDALPIFAWTEFEGAPKLCVGRCPIPIRVEMNECQLHMCLGQCWSEVQRLQGELLDRKSTRLNSSHVKISYAVFCLKKKK